MTKKAKIIWTVVGLILITPPLGLFIFDKKQDADLKREFDLAQKAGFAIHANDYRKAVAPAEPAENAAEFYRRKSGEKTVNTLILTDLLANPTGANLSEAKQLIAEHKDGLLHAVDLAAARPRCWFDRHWEDGYAVLFPEYAKMKNMAQLAAVRGTVAASEGRVDDALSDFRAINQMASHVEEEPVAIGLLVGQAIRNIGARAICTWDIQHPDPKYVSALKTAVENWPVNDYRKGYALELYWTTDILQWGSTKEGREKLGLPESEVSPMEGKVPPPLQKAALIKIIRAYREPYEVDPTDYRKADAVLHESMMEIYTAGLAFPTGAKIMESLSGDNNTFLLPLNDQSSKLVFMAILRALEQPSIPKTLDLSDLKSPYDGSPVTYAYDGQRITIQFATPGGVKEERTFTCPPKPRDKSDDRDPLVN